MERGERVLLLFGLANAGGMVAYTPLLTLLLPAKMAAAAGSSDIEWMAAATLGGAVCASVGNIAFGWLSDLVATRRLWMAAGLCLTLASYALLHVARSPATLVAAVCLYQLVLNMLLSPLAAWAAETVPDSRKGILGGLLGAGPLIGALAGVVATLPGLAEAWMRMAAVCALMFVLTAPLLLSAVPGRSSGPSAEATAHPKKATGADFALLWFARLLVQVAGNVLFGFLLYYFHTLPDRPLDAAVARLYALALFIAFPVALAFGGISDRVGRRKPFLLIALVSSALGLAMMASGTKLVPSAIGYTLFGSGSTVFLVLQSSYAMQLLPSPARRGRDLGVLNLTNTLPALVAPLLALWLVPDRGFAPLLALLAGLLLLAAFLTLLVRHDATGCRPN